MYASQRKTSDNAILTKGSILVVDDEPDITAISKAGLARAGFQVSTYNDPERVLSDFKPDAYDMIILDVRMPNMNGFELCRELRKKDERVKIYFMTAFEMYKTEFEKVFPSMKVDGFITKPVTMSDLCSLVQSALDKRSIQRDSSYDPSSGGKNVRFD